MLAYLYTVESCYNGHRRAGFSGRGRYREVAVSRGLTINYFVCFAMTSTVFFRSYR